MNLNLHLVILVEGMLTSAFTPNWADLLGAYLHEVCRGLSLQVEKKEYRAGPFPLWNLYWRNGRVARTLFEEIRMYGSGVTIDFVAHSNGSDVSQRAAKLLIEAEIPVRTLLMIGSVTHSDIVRSGLLPLVESGMLGRAIAYSSRKDLAVRAGAFSSYGGLGVDGWTFKGHKFIGLKFVTRRFDTFGHCDYFERGHRQDRVFKLICEDLGFSGTIPKAAA